MEHFVASLWLGSVDHWTWSAWSVDRFIPWKLLELIMECSIRHQPHNDRTESVLVTLNNECCGSPRVEKGLLIDHRAGRFLDVAVNRRLIEPLRGASQSLPITIEESSMLTACKTKPDEFCSCNLVIAKHELRFEGLFFQEFFLKYSRIEAWLILSPDSNRVLIQRHDTLLESWFE